MLDISYKDLTIEQMVGDFFEVEVVGGSTALDDFSDKFWSAYSQGELGFSYIIKED